MSTLETYITGRPTGVSRLHNDFTPINQEGLKREMAVVNGDMVVWSQVVLHGTVAVV